MQELSKETLKKFLAKKFPASEIQFINEGWSSIAFQVNDKIFRFRKGGNLAGFRKEQKVIDYARGRIKFEMPEITIIEDDEYPYSVHEKLNGNFWRPTRMGGHNSHVVIMDLPEALRDAFFNDIAEFLFAMHSIDKKDINKVAPEVEFYGWGGTRPEFMDKIGDMLTTVLSVRDTDIILKKSESAFAKIIGDTVFTHGDIHGENSLLNNNNELYAIFDWGNAKFDELEYDFSKLIAPDAPEFLQNIMAAYKKLGGRDIDVERAHELNLMDVVGCLWMVNKEDDLRNIKDREMEWIKKALRDFL